MRVSSATSLSAHRSAPVLFHFTLSFSCQLCQVASQDLFAQKVSVSEAVCSTREGSGAVFFLDALVVPRCPPKSVVFVRLSRHPIPDGFDLEKLLLCGACLEPKLSCFNAVLFVVRAPNRTLRASCHMPWTVRTPGVAAFFGVCVLSAVSTEREGR